MSRTKTYTSFADLNDQYTPTYHNLTVRPRRRTYLISSDAVYDYSVGHELVVADSDSPFDGCIVSVLDKSTLKRHGYTGLTLSYNLDRKVEIKL